MEKTFSKSMIKKFFYYFSCAAILIASVYISGCTGAKPEDPALARAKDSLTVYTQMEKAFTEYKTSLDYVEKENTKKATSFFEESLNTLKGINNRTLEDSANVQWKNDYIKLATSVTQDFLYTQKDIPDNSQVFKFAKKFNIKYDKISLNSELEGDVETLPNGSDVPLVRNSTVDEYIDFFSKTDRGKNFIDKTMYRSGKYFPLMRKILRYHKAPEEMIYLSVQESGLNPTIVSKAGAVGLWQFMPATGKSYGLYQDQYRDDRRDVEKSTDAAARHLKDLYRTFGDWYLAWAAYNAGPGRINGAISKSGSKDFWTLRSYLPGETKNYVPSILALSFIYRNPGDYGFKDPELGKPISFDRVNIDGELTLDKVAAYSESDIESVRELNSELLTDVVPDYDLPYQLRVPKGTYKTFIKNYKNSPDFKSNNSVEPEFAGNEASSYYSSEISIVTYEVAGYNPGDPVHISGSENKTKLKYTYRGNENLKDVADSFKVRESDIRRWNLLSWGVKPKANQELAIYLTTKQYNAFYGIKEEKKDDVEEVKKEETETVRNDYGKKDKEVKDKDVKVKKEEKVKKEKKEEKVKKEKKTPTEKLQNYTVKEGDNLSGIAEKYDVTTAELREWNGIEGDKILSGQKLKIYSNKKVTETKEKTTNKKATYHVVEEGDNLSDIANTYDVTVSDLKDWNDLDGDKIMVGQKLVVAEPKKTNTKEKTNTKKAKTHKVKEGENLTEIADKYDVSVEDIREWNNLKKDVIVPGQELIVSKTTKTKETSKETGKKTHKVKKGDTLASISEEYDVSIKDLKKWNDLESDGTIYIGQTLKLYDSTKTKKK
ncbi:MAG: LysM peptidoglycan-binding domain-containing protein [Ignavibacteriota bacterium]|nr:LysM peptidoglycan-binding domain-containing protein [Ignavibacteriota bacterium]